MHFQATHTVMDVPSATLGTELKIPRPTPSLHNKFIVVRIGHDHLKVKLTIGRLVHLVGKHILAIRPP